MGQRADERFGHVTNVQRNSHPAATGHIGEHVRRASLCIVWHAHTGNGKSANGPGLVKLQRNQMLRCARWLRGQSGEGFWYRVHRPTPSGLRGPCTTRMIGMLVGQKKRLHLGGFPVNERHALRQRARSKTGVNKDGPFGAVHQNGVSATATAKHRHRYHDGIGANRINVHRIMLSRPIRRATGMGDNG